MKRKALICLSALAAGGMLAAPLTPEQALERMNQSGRAGKASAIRLDASPVMTVTAKNGQAGVYVFNSINGKGFRVLAADDVAYPVLGYADDGTVDVNNLSPEFKWWISGMAEQIAAASGAKCADVSRIASDQSMTRIEPLVSTKWNQDAPFNNNAPNLSGSKCYTGCVATSMAQLMKYHNYPEKGQNSISYTWDRGSKTLSMDFSKVTFDWNNMLNAYQRGVYNDEQAEAVATLMEACGYAVQMNYGTQASGTQGSYIAEALKDYFGYDVNTYVDFRAGYSASEWAQKVWYNLKNVGPVVLNGHPYNDSGHSFICDGYDGAGYFHFNWGWGGASDGYYLLESMDPSFQGIGGSSGGFSYSVNAIFGAQKPTGQEEQERYANIIMYGGCTATISGTTLSFRRNKWYPDGWYCASGEPIKIVAGAIIEPVDGTPGEKQTKSGRIFGSVLQEFTPGSYFPTTNGPVVTLPTLADGKYKVTVGIKDSSKGASSPWNPVIVSYGQPNYVYVTVKDGVYSVENVPLSKLIPEALTLKSALYYGCMANFSAKLSNNTEYELTETVVPALLLNNAIAMIGNVAPSTVGPKSTAEISWPSTMKVQSGFSAPTTDKTYELAVINPITNEILGKYGEVTMKPQPKQQSSVAASEFNIIGVEPVEEEFGVYGNIKVYSLAENNFSANLAIRVQRGFFDGVVSLGIYKPNIDNRFDLEPVELGLFQAQPFLESGETETFTMPVTFNNYKSGEVYALRAGWSNAKGTNTLGNCYFRIGAAGVHGVTDDSTEAEARYYNLQGVEIRNPQPGQIVIVKKGSKSQKVRF